MYDVLVKRSNPIRHSITELQLKQYVFFFFMIILSETKLAHQAILSSHSHSLKTDMGWWTLKANWPQRCTCFKAVAIDR